MPKREFPVPGLAPDAADAQRVAAQSTERASAHLMAPVDRQDTVAPGAVVHHSGDTGSGASDSGASDSGASDRGASDRRASDQEESHPRLGADLQAMIGQQLRAVYHEILSEPVPERFVRLLESLATKEGATNTKESATKEAERP
jgi:hypothetical protein